MSLIEGWRRAWTLHWEYRAGHVRLWVRLGAQSVWLDPQMGRIEINGQDLAGRTFWARRPLRFLDGLKIDILKPGAGERNPGAGYDRLAQVLGRWRPPSILNGFRDALANPGVGRILALGLGFGVAMGLLGPARAFSFGVGTLAAAAMGVAALLGGQLRGFTSLVWGLAGSVLMLATPIGSALPSGAVFAIVINGPGSW